jgi:hypothetical protein
MFNNNLLMGAASAGGTSLVEVGNSALYTTTSQELERTPGSAGNVDKFTFSAWVYMCNPTSGNTPIFGAINTSANQHRLFTTAGGTLQFDLYLSNSFVGRVISSQVLRDIGWYHTVAVYDSGNAIAGDRMRIYLNGERITDLTSVVDPSQNLDGLICGAHLHQIGMHDGFGTTLDGYMAEAVLLDGTVAEPSSFGQYDSTGTFWTPKSSAEIKALTFGTTGFYLDNTTNAQTDASGTGNNFTNTGSVTLSTNTPTNINTLVNPLSMFQSMSLANGNNKVTFTAATYTGNIFTIPIPPTGKWKMEVDMTAITGGLIRMGIIEKTEYSPKNMATNIPFDHSSLGNPDFNTISTSGGNASAIGRVDGTDYNFASEANGSRVVSNGDRWGLYYDADSGKFWAANDDGSGDTTYFYEDSGGTAGNPATGSNPLATSNTSKSYQFYVTGYSDPTANRNFLFKEEADWILTTPTGYAPLTTANIALATTRTASDTTKYFETTLYEGSGSEQSVQSDTTTNTSAFSWIKNRDATDNHMLFDRVRGATKDLHSNTNDIEVTNAQTVKAFIGGGVTLGTDVEVNTNNESYVLWNWMIGTSGNGSSNEDGSINTTATLVDTTLGLSVSKYTGTGANATVGHGLGVAPNIMFIKNLGVTDSWAVYYGDNTDYLVLNTTAATVDDNTMWNDTTPTSSVFSVGSNHQVNASSETYIAYCFANSQFISVGSYIGNGNADGTFIPTLNSLGVSIQPSWIMIKASSRTSPWTMYDTSRLPYNVNTKALEADANTAEQTHGAAIIDIDTGGFKPRGSSYYLNESSATYTYLAMGTPIIDTDGRIITGR